MTRDAIATPSPTPRGKDAIQFTAPICLGTLSGWPRGVLYAILGILAADSAEGAGSESLGFKNAITWVAEISPSICFSSCS